MLARAVIRRRFAALAGLTLVASLGFGTALGAFAAAYRTQHAYPDYLAHARAPDLIVNPSLASTASDNALRTLPHVRGVTTYSLFIAGVGLEASTPGQLLSSDDVTEVRGSTDGDAFATNKLVVTEGAAPSGTREVFV